MQTFQTEQDIRSSVDEQLKNLGWIFKGKDRNVFQEQPGEDYQKKRLKGKRPDYVLYSSKEKYKKEPLMIIETKKPGANLKDALGQGDFYAKQLNAPLVFATDGVYYKTLHTKIHKPLYLNGEEVDELIRELDALKFLENNEVDTISKEVKYSRQELIRIFEDANNLLRDEGLRAGIERFGEFANILFLKLIGEIEDLKEEEGKRNEIIIDKYLRWSQWKDKKADELLSFVNDTVLQKIGEAYEDKEIFLPLSIKNPRALERIIDKLEPLKLINIDSDIKGDSFEYFLKQSTATKNDLGEYFTPRHIVKMMVKLVNPQFGEQIYDPFCGTGGMLIESFKHIYNAMPRNPRNLKILQQETIFGNEITSTARITKMNMILIGDGHSGVQKKNSLQNPVEDEYDVVITNMPYSQNTEYGSYYDLPSNNGDSICIQHCIKAVNKSSENGRIAIIVPEGFLFRKDMRKTREYLLKRNYLKSIISLPQGAFLPYTGVKTNVLYCTGIKKKKEKQQEKFWYFDVKNDGYSLDSQRKKLDGESDLQKFLAYRNTEVQEKKDVLSIGFSEISMEEVRKNDLVLSGNRYKKLVDYDKIPWDVYSIGEVCNIFNGSTPSTKEKSYWENGTIPWFTIEDIRGQGRIITNTQKHVTKKGFKNSSLRILPKNAILLCCTASVGEYALTKIELTTNQQFNALVIKEKFKEKLLPKFLFWVISYIKPELEKHVSSSFSYVSVGKLAKIQIPIPPVEKQQKLVNELDAYQNIIDGAKKIIRAYKPQITIDDDWEFVSLGNKELFEIQSGGTPDSKNREYWDGSINWITLKDLPPENFITEISESERKITKKGLMASSAKLLPKNTIVVSSRATIGRVGIVRVELTTNQGFKNIVIKTPKSINEKFIAFIMTSLVEKMRSMASGATFKEISKSNFEKLEIPLPSKAIQDKIVKRIEVEQALIAPSKKIYKFFKNKIQEKLNSIWGHIV
jgi:type I restriction enzyme M protein